MSDHFPKQPHEQNNSYPTFAATGVILYIYAHVNICMQQYAYVYVHVQMYTHTCLYSCGHRAKLFVFPEASASVSTWLQHRFPQCHRSHIPPEHSDKLSLDQFLKERVFESSGLRVRPDLFWELQKASKHWVQPKWISIKSGVIFPRSIETSGPQTFSWPLEGNPAFFRKPLWTFINHTKPYISV